MFIAVNHGILMWDKNIGYVFITPTVIILYMNMFIACGFCLDKNINLTN